MQDEPDRQSDEQPDGQPERPPERPPGRHGRSDGAERTAPYLAATRYVAALPVAVLALAALGAFVYAVALFVDSTRRIVDHPFPIGRNIGYFVVVIDILLVGATLLIAAFGFYELFVARPDDDAHQTPLLPRWLVMRDLNDLKVRVISMIVLVASVSFVDKVVDFEGGRDVLYLGVAIAAVVVALTLFIRLGAREH
ncbi:MAG TPA: YqhA family protein [Acidimicrobiales bacterium]|nr:YqhA family protein [Acidimicrobiales bacterium]